MIVTAVFTKLLNNLQGGRIAALKSENIFKQDFYALCKRHALFAFIGNSNYPCCFTQ